MALTDKLTAIADAIREKTGKAEKLSLLEMPQEIKSISGGGSTNTEFSKFLSDTTYVPTTLIEDAKKNSTKITSYKMYSFTSPEIVAACAGTWEKLSTISSLGLYGFGVYSYIVSTGSKIEEDPKLIMYCPELVDGSFEANYSGFTGLTLHAPKLRYTDLDDGAFTNSCFFKLIFDDYWTFDTKNMYQPLTRGGQKLVVIDIRTHYLQQVNCWNYAPFISQENSLRAVIIRSETVPQLLNGTPYEVFASKTPIGNQDTSYTNGEPGYIYVPQNLIEEYKSATNWSVAADYFRAIEDYPEICGEV